MLDYLRYALYATLIVILFFLFQEWQKEHPKTAPLEVVSQKTETSYIPKIAETTAPAVAKSSELLPPTSSNIITITTDVLEVKVDALGGNIVQINLLKYPETLHATDPIVLLNNNPETRYLAQSGLISQSGPDTGESQALYTIDQKTYTLSENQNEIKVPLHWKNDQGITVTKLFTFKRKSYEIDMDYTIQNLSKQNWEGNLFLQLMRKNTPPPNTQGFVNLATYFGAAISSPEKRFKKIPFKTIAAQDLNQTITDGWFAMIQHYFISAWVPDKKDANQYFTKMTDNNLYTIGLISPSLNVSAGETATKHSKFYAGPSIANQLETVAPGLQLTIDYGWFWFISAIIFWMMQKIYDVVHNWGWSIVIVTLIIKLLFYHLSAKSYRSMSAMKKLQPKINLLKEKLGDDKQKFTQATLELYKKEKVNPMNGCLPVLVQIPVFIGLYWVLIESVQLRHAPFILWIHDLSSKDPYYVLPVLMGLAMFFQQRLNPPPPDPMQAKIMMFMPVAFVLLFMNFPAGLMLYWFVNNTLSFLQQWFIMHSMAKVEKVKK